MSGIQKEYYSLEETKDHWNMPHRDLVYLAENGMLKVSVRLYGIRVETGYYEDLGDGNCDRIPEEFSRFCGLKDLQVHDVYRLFHKGQVTVDNFSCAENGYCHVLQPEDGIVIKQDELVVSREERDRVEAKHGLGNVQRATTAFFQHRNNFADVTVGDCSYTLGPIQAKVVALLYDAAKTGSPWRHGQTVLGEAGSKCTRISDLFKAQPEWRKLIQSDKRGKYRLNINFS